MQDPYPSTEQDCQVYKQSSQNRVPNLPARYAFSFSVVPKGHSTKGRSTQEVESAIEEEEDDAKLPGFLGELAVWVETKLGCYSGNQPSFRTSNSECFEV